MSGLTGTAIVCLTGLIVLRGWLTGNDVYGTFLKGAEKGMHSALALLPALCAMLLRQFRLMQHIKIMQFEKLSTQDIKQRLGIAPFAAERCMRQASGYSGGQVKRAVRICLDAEYRVKSGQWNQEGALEKAMLEIFALRT